jgi:hypothetical protein
LLRLERTGRVHPIANREHHSARTNGRRVRLGASRAGIMTHRGTRSRLAGLLLTAGVVTVLQPVPATADVAGIAIPKTPLAMKAETYVRSVEPDFLFNHSVRTFIFGSLKLKAAAIGYDPETAYVAALFHDLGLVPSLASPAASFEVDGANHAEQFIMTNGGTAEQSRIVWNAIVMHDMGRLYQGHQSPEASLVGAGAASDVDGVDPNAVPPSVVAVVLQAYPRLQFKQRFTKAAIDHCLRKPTSQIGWLETLCLKVAPTVDRGSVEEEIASAPFSE